MKLVKIGLIVFMSVAILIPLSWAGNKEIIEKRIVELDNLNKQAVRQIPNLPKSGRVRLKANVIPELDGVRFKVIKQDIQKRTVMNTPSVLSSSSSRMERHLTFSDALSRYSNKPAEIIGFRDDSDGEEYIPMKVGILRLTQKVK